MKYAIGIIMSIIVGGVIGFFGVFVSVFADGSLQERLFTIGAILLIYFVLAGIWGLLLRVYAWKWGLLIGAPGALMLGAYMLKEYNYYYFVYIILIFCFSCLGSWTGSAIKKRKRIE